MNDRNVFDVSELLMMLLKSEISGMPLELNRELTEEDMKSLYRFANRYDLAHLAADALEKNGMLKDDEISLAFAKKKRMAIYRYVKLDTVKNEICEVFEKEKIEFIPLKGSVIREIYPEPWMRTSCDIDILVREEDLERASVVLREKCGYEQEMKNDHDISFWSQNRTHIELHYTLIAHKDEMDQILKNVWEVSYPSENSNYFFEMPDEFFYFYHIAHMAKHFQIGGCGIRPFLDLWVLNHCTEFDPEKRNALLKEAEISDFAKAAEDLSEIWFGDQKHSRLTKEVEDYLFKGGTYGSYSNKISAYLVKNGGKWQYLQSRIWLPYDKLKIKYPILEKHPYLMPFCEVSRWIELPFSGRLNPCIREVKVTKAVEEDSKTTVAPLLQQLGLWR